jgi:hypothetical protein
MSDRAWEHASMEATEGTGRRQLVTRLFVVAALTMAAGYYLPLHRSHSALVAAQQTMVDENSALKRDLATAKSELTAANATHAALAAKDDQAEEGRAHEKAQHDAALSALSADLERRLDRKASVAVRDDHVVVSFPAAATKGLDKGPASAVASRLGLCDVAAALQGSARVDVVAHVDSVKEWDKTSRRAAKVAEALEGTCHVASGKTAASARSEPSGSDASLELLIDVGTAPAH